MNLFPQACLSDVEASFVDSQMPGNQVKNIGSRLQVLEQRGMHIQQVNVAADATAGKAFTAEVGGTLVDAWVVCTATNGSGTLTLRRVATALTSAIVCAVVNVPSRTALVLTTGSTIVQGEALNVISAGAADRGILYICIARN